MTPLAQVATTAAPIIAAVIIAPLATYVAYRATRALLDHLARRIAIHVADALDRDQHRHLDWDDGMRRLLDELEESA